VIETFKAFIHRRRISVGASNMVRVLHVSPMLLILLTLTVTPAGAATETEIAASISKGLSWLVSQQQPDGSWSPDYYPVGVTGQVLLKLEAHALLQGRSLFD
jgi:hypothetical protein